MFKGSGLLIILEELWGRNIVGAILICTSRFAGAKTSQLDSGSINIRLLRSGRAG